MIGSITSLNSAHKKEKRLKQKRRVLKRLLKYKSSDNGDSNNKKSSINVANETNTNTNKMIVIQNSTQFSISFFLSPTLYNFIIVYLIKYSLVLSIIYLIFLLIVIFLLLLKNQTLNCSIKSDDESIYNKLLFFFVYSIRLHYYADRNEKKIVCISALYFLNFARSNCKYNKDILGN